jgi:hypothetical protein
LYLLSIKAGIRYTYDSVEYLVAAESFAKEGVFRNSDGTFFQHWPPLYPLMLSFFINNIQEFLITFNWICLLGTFCLMSWLATKTVDNRSLKILFCLTLVFGVPLYLISKFAWSEPFFLLLLSLQLCLLYRYSIKGDIKLLVLLSVVGVLYCLQRKAGIFMMMGIGLAFLMTGLRNKEFKHLILFIFVSLTFIPSWYLLTSSHISFLTFTNHEPRTSIVSLFFVETLSVWIIPPLIPKLMQVTISIFLIVSLIYQYHGPTKDFFLNCLLMCFLSYTFFMQLFPYADNTETERYLSVIYPLLFLLIFKFLDSLLSQLKKNKKLVLISLFIWILYPAARTIKNVVEWSSDREKAYAKTIVLRTQ